MSDTQPENLPATSAASDAQTPIASTHLGSAIWS